MAKTTSKTLTIRPVNSDHTIALLDLVDKTINDVELLATYNSEMLQIKIKGERDAVSSAMSKTRRYSAALKTSMFPDINGKYTHDLATLQLINSIQINKESLLEYLRQRAFSVFVTGELIKTDASMEEISDAMAILRNVTRSPLPKAAPLVRRSLGLLAAIFDAKTQDILSLGLELGLLKYVSNKVSLAVAQDVMRTTIIDVIKLHGNVQAAMDAVIQQQQPGQSEEEEDEKEEEIEASLLTSEPRIVLKGEQLKEWAKELLEEE